MYRLIKCTANGVLFTVLSMGFAANRTLKGLALPLVHIAPIPLSAALIPTLRMFRTNYGLAEDHVVPKFTLDSE